MHSFHVRALSLTLALAPGLALAQDANQESEEPSLTVDEVIVVSATGTETPARLVGSSVTVIDRMEIEARDKVTVLELLRTVPGLEVSSTGGPGGATSVFVRGANSNATLVLFDGVRANSPTGGGFDFAEITTDNVERIEVLRGPQGALYGAEAIGGVISISTRRGSVDGVTGNMDVEGGTDDYGRLQVGVRGGRGTVDYSVTASHQQNDGFSKASERAGNSEKDDWQNSTATAALGVDFADDGRFDVSVRAFDAETGLDGFEFLVGPVDDLDYQQVRAGLFLSTQVSKDVGGKARLSFRAGVAQDELEGIDPTTFFNNFLIDSQIAEADIRADVALSQSDTLTLGYTFQDQDGSSLGSFDVGTDLSSFYLQNQWTHGDDLSIVVGVRNDDHSTFGDETTYRGSVSYLLPSATRLHASVGTGFKAPSYFDLFFPFFGNPNLKAETSTGWDLGFSQSLYGERASFDVTYFDNQFDDLISFDADFEAVNIAEASARGVETSFGWVVSERFRWDINHTWTDSEDDATRAQLARRPKQRLTTSLFFEPSKAWRSTVTVVAVQDRIDSDGSPMDDYERLDASVSYRVREGLRLGARLMNLLDQTYEEINGFTTPGFQAALTLVYGR